MTIGDANKDMATVAGGCFWCIEAIFEMIEGVDSVVSGYTGGHTENPTYEEICSGVTGHAEAVQIQFEKARIDYETILNIFSVSQTFDRRLHIFKMDTCTYSESNRTDVNCL